MMQYTKKSIVGTLEPTYLFLKEVLAIEVKQNKNPGLEAYPYFVVVNRDPRTTYISDGKALYRMEINEEKEEAQQKEHEAIAEGTTTRAEFIEKLGGKFVEYVDLKPIIVETPDGELVEEVADIVNRFNLLA